MLILSCHQKLKEIDCNEIINDSFKGNAIIFFHKPISGSTYQFFLFPQCNADLNNKLDDVSAWGHLPEGVSFDITSDDQRFKTIFNNAKKINLKDRDQLAENLRFIYYCFAKVEFSSANDGFKNKEELKKLTLDSDTVILKYHFISRVAFKIIN